MPFHHGIKKHVTKTVNKAVRKATGKKAVASKLRGPGSARAKPPVPTAKPKRVPPLMTTTSKSVQHVLPSGKASGMTHPLQYPSQGGPGAAKSVYKEESRGRYGPSRSTRQKSDRVRKKE